MNGKLQHPMGLGPPAMCASPMQARYSPPLSYRGGPQDRMRYSAAPSNNFFTGLDDGLLVDMSKAGGGQLMKPESLYCHADLSGHNGMGVVGMRAPQMPLHNFATSSDSMLDTLTMGNPAPAPSMPLAHMPDHHPGASSVGINSPPHHMHSHHQMYAAPPMYQTHANSMNMHHLHNMTSQGHPHMPHQGMPPVPQQHHPGMQPHHHPGLHELDCDPRELEAFAERFKQRRIKLGVTQADVGGALAKLKLPGVGALSQSTICRFESLTLSHNNMIALKPVLHAWLEEAEKHARERLMEDDINGGSDKKRKRTSIAAPEKRSLEAYFAVQPRPSGEKIAQIAEKLDLKKNVVRVWFCNQRQKQKRMKFSATVNQ